MIKFRNFVVLVALFYIMYNENAAAVTQAELIKESVHENVVVDIDLSNTDGIRFKGASMA